MTTVLVFGAFDGVHPGHANFLGEAKSLGDRLVVCLATDDAIRRHKGRPPLHTFDDRRAALRLLPSVDDVVSGDDEDGRYTVIAAQQPNVIAFGYDQQALHDDCVAFLDRHGLAAHTVVLPPFEPDKYKSSILNKRDA